MYIQKKVREEIKELIKTCERRTDCEIVPMIISQSNNYVSAQYTLAILMSFLFSTVLYLSPLASIINPIYYILMHALGFIVGFLLAKIDKIKRLFISKKEIHYEVYLKTCEAFLEKNLHLTPHHNGVLIMVSLLERKIQILCDRAVREKIDSKIWDDLIEDFIQTSRKEDIISALKNTLIQTTNVLESHFPYNENTPKRNYLDDDLIIDL